MTAVRFAIKNLLQNKLRSFLTVLGILIGSFSLLIVNSLGMGAGEKIKQVIRNIGTNILYVLPAPGMRFRKKQVNLTDEDVKAVSKILQVESVSGILEQILKVNSKKDQFSIRVRGVSPQIKLIKNLELLDGRFIDYLDIKLGEKVCVIPKLLAKKLGVEKVGRKLFVNGVPVTVVGIINNKGNNFDDMLMYMPISFLKRLVKKQYYNLIVLSTFNEKQLDKVEKEIFLLFWSKYGKAFLKEYDILNQATLLASMDKITKVFQLFFLVVAMVSLVVGGIGIMNIMLVSVIERVKEIGIRKTLGATKLDILLLFLIEAIILSIVGAVIGVLIAAGVLDLIKEQFNIKIIISVKAVILTLFIPMIISVIFSIYPAMKAANLNPVEALRYE